MQTSVSQTLRRIPSLLVVLVAVQGVSGCRVAHPPGWPSSPRSSLLIKATPGKMYGTAPLSWSLPDGDSIRIRVDRASVLSGAGLYHADIAFDVEFASAPKQRIRCESEPAGPMVPPTRFGCWTTDAAGTKVTFWLAPGEDCPARHVAHTKTLVRPPCWNGMLTTDGESIELQHGYLASLGSPVGYVSWLGPDQQPILAADIVREMQIEVYPLRDKAQLADRTLILLTVALHWWEHSSRAT